MKFVELDRIVANKDPVRRTDRYKNVDIMSSNIDEFGMIMPVKLRPLGDGNFEVVWGDRRVEAARRAGWSTVPAVIDDVHGPAALIEAFVENVHRESMEPVDEAIGLRRIMDETGWSQAELARKGLGSTAWISRRLSLLQEDESVQESVSRAVAGHVPKGRVSLKHVTGVRKEEDLDAHDRAIILEKAAKESLTVDETEDLANLYARAVDDEARQAILDNSYHDPAFGQKVRASASLSRKRGREEAGKERRGEYDRIVKEYMSALRAVRTMMPIIMRAAKEGKFSPEAARFVAKWHDDIHSHFIALEEVLDATV